jgi:hypothetical protein
MFGGIFSSGELENLLMNIHLRRLKKNFHRSVQHPVACVIEVTINTVYATLLYIILYWKMFFYCDMFRFSRPSSSNIYIYIYMSLRKLLYLQRIRCFGSNYLVGIIIFVKSYVYYIYIKRVLRRRYL